MSFLKFFNEAKQVGIIYHFTTPYAIGILSDSDYFKNLGCEIFTFISKNDHISTTRGYYMSDNPFADINVTSHPIRIAFNGDKISDKFKIKPINGLTVNNTEIFGTNLNHLRVPHKSEKEEVICPIKGKYFELKDFILEIQINGYVYKGADELKLKLEDRLKKEGLNIPINLVRKWKPFGRSSREMLEAVPSDGYDSNPMIYEII